MNEELTGLRDEMRQGFADMRQEMRQGFARVDERLGKLGQDVTELRGDVTELRGDVTELRGDVTELRGDVTELPRSDVTELREDVTELRGNVAGLRQGLAALSVRVDALEQRVRANGVLLEAMRDDVRLDCRGARAAQPAPRQLQSEGDAQRAIIALLQTSYRDLDRRLTRLEERAGEAGSSLRP